MQMAAELPWLWAALAAYAVATIAAVLTVAPRYSGAVKNVIAQSQRSREQVVLGFLALGVVLLTIMLAVRWQRLGHGPFVELFELLASQLWSLGIFYLLVYWRMPQLRGTAVIVFPAMWILGSWVLTLDPAGGFYPATYYNNWKWAHVGLGKIFLAACLVGVGLAGVILLRRTRLARLFTGMPSDEVLDRVAWRFMMVALIFDSLMLIAGAVWAQDAWGRYWDWDELETSSFINWLVLGASIHLRLTYRIPLAVGAWMIIGIFVFAFMTYFGMPYISPAAHKGVI